MNGVEILASKEVAIAWERWNWTGFWIAVGIVFIGTLICGIIAGIEECNFTLGLIVFLVTFIVGGALFGCLIGFTTGKPIEYETRYKITIDDSVSMNEFLDKYEIIDQEGKIYTVKEKAK